MRWCDDGFDGTVGVSFFKTFNIYMMVLLTKFSNDSLWSGHLLFKTMFKLTKSVKVLMDSHLLKLEGDSQIGFLLDV